MFGLLQIKSVGQDLYNKVVQKLEVLEADYFDIQYTDVQGILVSGTDST